MGLICLECHLLHREAVGLIPDWGACERQALDISLTSLKAMKKCLLARKSISQSFPGDAAGQMAKCTSAQGRRRFTGDRATSDGGAWRPCRVLSSLGAELVALTALSLREAFFFAFPFLNSMQVSRLLSTHPLFRNQVTIH